MSDDDVTEALTAALAPMVRWLNDNWERIEAAVATYERWGIEQAERHANGETE